MGGPTFSMREQQAVPTSRRDGFFASLFVLLVIGYFTMSRTFAYLGVPPLHLFIGELSLGAFLVLGPTLGARQWPWLALDMRPLRPLFLFVVALITFGCFQSTRGILNGYEPIVSLRDLAFDYYPLFLFFGVWYGFRYPSRLKMVVRRLAWWNGVYGLLYLLLLSNVAWNLPGVSDEVAQVQIFGQPQASALSILALVCLEDDVASMWVPLALNAIVLIGMIVRGEWLAFFLALVVYAWVQKNMKRVIAGAAFVLVLVAVMFIFDLAIPVPENRVDEQGAISAREIVGRVLAPLNADQAAKYSKHADIYEGTTTWRVLWWINIWESSQESPTVMLLGHGYGYPLGNLNPYLDEVFIRTPHSFLMYGLGYTGWIGLLLFLSFQIYLGHRMLVVQRISGQPFGIVIWTFCVVDASFAGFFEVPHGAIPSYLLLGCFLGAYGLRRGVGNVLARPLTAVTSPYPKPQPTIGIS
jgi:hypothetical protein